MKKINDYTSEELKEILQEKQAEEKKAIKIAKKEEAPFDRKVVLFVLTVSLIVLAISFFIVYKTGVEPSTTVTAWFGFGGIEVWALAFLRNGKRKIENNIDTVEKEYGND